MQLAVGRVPISSTDFSLGTWTYDDTDGDPDMNLSSFSIAHDERIKIPFLKRAMALAA